MRAFNSWHFILGENDISRKYALTISLAVPCQMFFAKKAEADKYTFRGIEGTLLRVRVATTMLRSFRVHTTSW